MIMPNEDTIRLKGRVCDGLGEGSAFVKLEGYRVQFVERLGYEPYPGTLNMELTEDGQGSIGEMEDIDPLVIEGWSDDETEYGPVHCYPAVLRSDGNSETVHVVRPVRTRHDDDTLEIVSPDKLRTQVDIDTGDLVTVFLDSDRMS